jgi:hypothetical protein
MWEEYSNYRTLHYAGFSSQCDISEIKTQNPTFKGSFFCQDISQTYVQIEFPNDLLHESVIYTYKICVVIQIVKDISV